VSAIEIQFPIFRKYFHKHGKPKGFKLDAFQVKRLTGYDLTSASFRGIEIAYLNTAHP
jgi:hypothetical protein